MILPLLLFLVQAQMIYHFPDGSRCTYTGTVLRDSNQEHGAGRRDFDNDEFQEGEFCDGNLSGYGRCECEWSSVSQA
jgi:hypothetical protein